MGAIIGEPNSVYLFASGTDAAQTQGLMRSGCTALPMKPLLMPGRIALLAPMSEVQDGFLLLKGRLI